VQYIFSFSVDVQPTRRSEWDVQPTKWNEWSKWTSTTSGGDTASKNAWKFFVCASRQDDVGLGPPAIGFFAQDANCPANRLNKIDPREIEGLTQTWLVELLRLHLGSKQRCEEDRYLWLSCP